MLKCETISKQAIYYHYAILSSEPVARQTLLCKVSYHLSPRSEFIARVGGMTSLSIVAPLICNNARARLCT